jgi:hypothetical protein
MSDLDIQRRNVINWSILGCVLLFVGGVSAYDGYLVVRTGNMIGDFERNPVGLRLIELNDGDPSLFLRAKAAGTVVVLTVLAFLHVRSCRLASPISLALVVFQLALLLFLESPL